LWILEAEVECRRMTIGSGFKARLEFVLEQVFEGRSGGGDHESRAFVAARLLKAAQSGIVRIDDLKRVAQEALNRVPKSA
jgi:hypothetical protein